jgi:hypothetical protein
VKAQLKERKQALVQKLANDVEARKNAKDQEEAERERKAMQEKQKSTQIKQMYADTKVRAKELKDKYKEELLLSRRILKNEMNRALKAIKPAEKIELVKLWRDVYKPEIVDELLRVAKDKEARLRIANWNLDNFDGERRTK